MRACSSTARHTWRNLPISAICVCGARDMTLGRMAHHKKCKMAPKMKQFATRPCWREGLSAKNGIAVDSTIFLIAEHIPLECAHVRASCNVRASARNFARRVVGVRGPVLVVRALARTCVRVAIACFSARVLALSTHRSCRMIIWPGMFSGSTSGAIQGRNGHVWRSNLLVFVYFWWISECSYFRCVQG